MPEAATFQAWCAGAITADRAPGQTPPSFAVYRNTWLKGLLDALDANYPTVAMILGAERFEAMARQFVGEHPAQTPVLALFGEEFPEFVACQPISREIPYLTDVAALERLWTECLFAPDAPVLDARTYAALEPAELLRLRPCVHPATRFKRFETPAVTIWQAHRAKNGFEEIEPEWKAERALVTRHGMSISVDPMDEATHHLLLEIQRGHSLGFAIDQTAGVHPAPNLACALSTVISSGALAAPRAEGERIW